MALTDLIAAVIVTYNRKETLKHCIKALLIQVRPPNLMIIIDNCSTDGTERSIRQAFGGLQSVEYLNLGINKGGAGGFYYGAKLALNKGADWIWMMDDDCIPEDDCLEKLIKGVKDNRNIYSPIILSSKDRSTALWGIDAQINTGNREVITLPFNGFLIHRESIKEIGFPDEHFFIYGDDTEYNLRAKASGRKIIMVTDSIMYHPHKNKLDSSGIMKMFLNKVWTYYKLRNAIIIYKKYKYFSINQIIMFISALFFYLFTLNFKFLFLWIEGFKDGLKGRLYLRQF